MVREYPKAPLVGVGVVVYNEQKKVILVRRGNDPNKGLWAIPGGNVEIGEQVHLTAIRELLEECNVHIEPYDLLGVVDLILKDNNGKVQYHYVLIEYLAKYVEGELKPGSDVSNTGWFAKQELSGLAVPEVTMKILEKAFQKIG
ncbi:MAG: NUDIX hydrolase [bacterium]|nr:NUDIX hydrolase [bacterium]